MDLHDTRDNELLAQVPAATTATLAAVVAPPAAAPSTSEGSSAVRVAAPPQPPLDQPARQNGSLTRRVDVVVGLLTSAGQLMAWRRGAASAAGLSTARHVDQLALVAMNAAFLLQALCLPYAWWLRFRVPIITALRIATILVLTQRTATGGIAPLLLYRAATPGWRGAAADWLRVVAGIRVLRHALIGALLPQPLLAVLAQQATMMLLNSRPADYCATPLLSDPLTRQRVARAVEVVDAVPALLATHMAGVAGVVTDGSRVCVAFLVWHQVMLGVMVPLFFQAFTRRTYLLPPPPPPPPHAALPALRPAGWRRALAAWQRAWRGADAALTELCTGVGYEGHQLALAAWMLLGNVWLLCVAAATRIVLAEDPA